MLNSFQVAFGRTSNVFAAAWKFDETKIKQTAAIKRRIFFFFPLYDQRAQMVFVAPMLRLYGNVDHINAYFSTSISIDTGIQIRV